MHILLTRPLEDCIEMISKFKSLGHQISHIPLLNIEPVEYNLSDFNDFKAIIFTSANAIKFLNIKNLDKNTLCFCVGSATEKKARSVGFQKVIAADGNVTNLKELIVQNFNTSDGVLYSVFDDYGFGDISSPVACTAVDVGDLDVTLVKE